MKDKDKGRFVSILEAMGNIYDINLQSTAIINLWFEAFQAYSIEEVGAAVTKYIKSPDYGSYKPKPADIIRMLEGTSDDIAYLAWSKVIKAVQQVGTYDSVVFDDPIIHKVVDDMGGWTSFGSKKETELPFVQKEFVTRYRAIKSKGILPEYNSKLIGHSEIQNGIEGWSTQPPVLIGDKGTAQLVYEKRVVEQQRPLITR